LEDWFKSGVKTLEDVKIKEELYKIDKKEQKESLKSNNTSKKNRFINFIQRNQDYAELERLEEEYIEESLKG
jgi:DNA replication protein DnaD